MKHTKKATTSISDEEFLATEIGAGITPNNPDYYNLMDATAEIIKGYGAKHVIEIGAGVGTLGECLIKRGIEYYGIEPSPFHRGFARARGVELHWGDYPKQTDMLVSIEVLEHIKDKDILEYMKIDAPLFYFSSTSQRTDWDIEWGHINIKTEEEWLKFFTMWKLKERMTLPTSWSLMFEKC